MLSDAANNHGASPQPSWLRGRRIRTESVEAQVAASTSNNDHPSNATQATPDAKVASTSSAFPSSLAAFFPSQQYRQTVDHAPNHSQPAIGISSSSSSNSNSNNPTTATSILSTSPSSSTSTTSTLMPALPIPMQQSPAFARVRRPSNLASSRSAFMNDGTGMNDSDNEHAIVDDDRMVGDSAGEDLDIDMDTVDSQRATPSSSTLGTGRTGLPLGRQVQGGQMQGRQRSSSLSQSLTANESGEYYENNEPRSPPFSFGSSSASNGGRAGLGGGGGGAGGAAAASFGYSASPPRSVQSTPSTSVYSTSQPSNSHMQLARLASEQQQALQASMQSGNYMLPQSMRSGGKGKGRMIDEDDILVSDSNTMGSARRRYYSSSQARISQSLSMADDDEDDNMMEEDGDNDFAGDGDTEEGIGGEDLDDDADTELTRGFGEGSEPMSRSFNPLNPYSLPHRTAKHKADTDKAGPYATGFSSMDDEMGPSESSNPLRSSRSTPSLSGLTTDATANTTGDNSALSSSSSSLVPALQPASQTSQTQRSPISFLSAPSTPPPPNLRRSQSASHRSVSLTNRPREAPSNLLSSPLTPNRAMPSTATIMEGAADSGFPIMRTRSNSFSGSASGSTSNAGSNIAPGAANTRPLQGFGKSRDSHRQASNDTNMDNSALVTPNLKHRPHSHSSGSDSNSTPNQGARVVRRAVNHKKGSLMPKSKDHLRIISQLRLETGEFEVASEAALHRLSQSAATPALPAFLSPRSHRSSTAGASASGAFANALASGSGTFGGWSSSHLPLSPHPPFGGGENRPTTASSTSSTRPALFPPHPSGMPPMQPVKNRFPESAVEDDDQELYDSSGSDEDAAQAALMFDTDYSNNGTNKEDEDSLSVTPAEGGSRPTRMISNPWQFRDPATSSLWATQNKPFTPGGARPAGTELELSPSSVPGWSATTASRPGKRKMNDSERFEPYNSAFKRRAVSPASASASSVSLSPLLSSTTVRTGNGLDHLPSLTHSAAQQASPFSTNGQAQTPSHHQSGGQPFAFAPPSSLPPSPIPQPGGSWLTGGSTTFTSNAGGTSKSRGSSPAPSAASSTGGARRWSTVKLEKDDDKSSNKVDLGKMSLG